MKDELSEAKKKEIDEVYKTRILILMEAAEIGKVRGGLTTAEIQAFTARLIDTDMRMLKIIQADLYENNISS